MSAARRDHRHGRGLRRRPRSRGDARRDRRAAARRSGPIAAGIRPDWPVTQRGRNPRLQCPCARRRSQAAQADPPHRPGRHLRGRPRRRSGGLRRVSRHACRPTPSAGSPIAPASTSDPAAARSRTSTTTFPLMSEANGDLRAFGRDLADDGQSDVAAAHAAEQRAVPRRDPQPAEGRERLHHQPQRRRHAGRHRGGGSAAQRRSRSRARDRPRHADRAAERAVLPRLRAARDATALRPFDAARSGSLFGEGAGALALETRSRRARAQCAGPRRSAGRRLRQRGVRAAGDPRRRRRRRARHRRGARRRRHRAARRRHDRRARQRHARSPTPPKRRRCGACSARDARRSPHSNGRSDI